MLEWFLAHTRGAGSEWWWYQHTVPRLYRQVADHRSLCRGAPWRQISAPGLLRPHLAAAPRSWCPAPPSRPGPPRAPPGPPPPGFSLPRAGGVSTAWERHTPALFQINYYFRILSLSIVSEYCHHDGHCEQVRQWDPTHWVSSCALETRVITEWSVQMQR